jgi:uncharacterized protein YraI
MKTRKFALAGFVSLALVLSGCNFPFPSSELSLNDQAATFVAMTLNATTPGQPVQSSPTPRPANSPSPTATINLTSTGTITPTYSVPMLKVNEATNCRTGPGQSYPILFTLLPGATVEIAGKAPAENYWVVKLPDGNRTCWLWGEFTTASGSYWAVPTVNPPPTSTASPPVAPSISNWEYTCGFGNATITIEWRDRAEDESGYRIYRDDEKVTELPPNSSSFTEVVPLELGETVSYRVEAFNNAGASSASPISFSCE